MKIQARQFIKNALLCVAASLAMRTVAVTFNTSISLKMGEEGMGLYMLVMSVYGFAVTFATSGVHLAVSRRVSEAQAKGDESLAIAYVRHALGYASLFGICATLVLFFFAPQIGAYLLRDTRTIPSLRLLGISMLPLSLSTVLNGYFIAKRKASYNAFLQVFEMAVRILCITLFLHFMLPSGIESGCKAIVLGGVLAEISSFAVFFALFVAQKGKKRRKSKSESKAIVKSLASVAMPMAASAYVRSGLLTAEHALIPVKIEQSGRSRKEALADYGVLQGMALPIVLYPTAILYAVSGLLIPEFAERAAVKKTDAVRALCLIVLRLTAMFGFGCALVMAVFGDQLGTLLYRSTAAGQYVWALAPLLPVMFLDHMTDAMLKGLGEQVWTMWVNIFDSVISIVLVVLLLPIFGAKGYILVIILAEILNFSLSFGRLLYKVKVKLYAFDWLFCPLASAVLASMLTELLMPQGGGTGLWQMILRIVFCVFCYAFIWFLLSFCERLYVQKGQRKPKKGRFTHINALL